MVAELDQKSSKQMQIQTKIRALPSLSTVEHQKRPAMAVEMVGVMDMVGGVISRIITGVVEPQKHPKVRERSDRVREQEGKGKI